MRILTFQGTYSYRPKEFFEGLICLCHVEIKDSLEKLSSIAWELITVSSDIIIVPFSHLHESAMDKESARYIISELGNQILALGKSPIMVPFDTAKEFHLDTGMDDSVVKFLHF